MTAMRTDRRSLCLLRSLAQDRGLLRSLAQDRGLLRSLAQDRGLLRSLALLAVLGAGAACTHTAPAAEMAAVHAPVTEPAPVAAPRAVAQAEVTPDAAERVDGFAVVRIDDALLGGDAATVPRAAGATEVAFDPGRHHETFRASYGRDRLAARVAGGGIGRVRLPEGDDFAFCGAGDDSDGQRRVPIRWERLVSDGAPGLAALQVSDGWLQRDSCRVSADRSVSLPLESIAWGTTYLLRHDRARSGGEPALVLLLPRADRLVARGAALVDRGAITYVFWPKESDPDDPPAVELEIALADLERWSLGLGPLPSGDRPRTSAELAGTPVVRVQVTPRQADDAAGVRARVLVEESWLERRRTQLVGLPAGG